MKKEGLKDEVKKTKKTVAKTTAKKAATKAVSTEKVETKSTKTAKKPQKDTSHPYRGFFLFGFLLDVRLKDNRFPVRHILRIHRLPRRKNR